MAYNNRILIVDDNRSIHEDFRKILCVRESKEKLALNSIENALFGADDEPIQDEEESDEIYSVDSAYQGKEALDMVVKSLDEACPYALVFMDMRMPPGWDGVETIARLWGVSPYTEVVICTAYSDYSWDEIVNKLGSTDKLLFLKKPFDAVEVKQMALSLVKKWNLSEQARNYVAKLEEEVNERTKQLRDLLDEVKKKNQALADSNKQLEHLALHDPLTQLPNRVLFNDRLRHGINISSRNQQSFAIAIMDLNKFKEVNDNLGHLIGDEVLKQVASRMGAALRTSDTIARLGGDEFALILPTVNQTSIQIVAEKIIKAFDPPIAVINQNILIGTSIGFALFPEHGVDAMTLVKHADVAMYQAKVNRSGWSCFDMVRDAERLSKIQLIHDLQSALLNDQLSLRYQPIFDTENGKVVALEALSEWIHPKRGLIKREEFIPIAEQEGMIKPLTHWILDKAMEQCAAWYQQGYQVNIGVNLTLHNLTDPSLADKICELVSKHALPKNLLTLEISESMTLHDPGKALEVVETLANLGFTISVDDFGTGFSSLSYLKMLPVRELKIDKVFVNDIDKDIENQAIVRSTIELAHALGLKVVAEGVTSQACLDLLNQMGCDKVQGAYLCDPLPGDKLTPWLNGDFQVKT